MLEYLLRKDAQLAEHSNKSLSGQLRPITGTGCFWASSDRVS